MKPAELTAEAVFHVVERMRAKDRAEIFATQWEDDDWKFANGVLRVANFAFALHADDGEPVACCGAVPMWEGVWSVWMFATDRFPEIAIGTHRFAKEVFFPNLDYAGWHRLECRSLASHTTAHRWLEKLGAYKESEVAKYGRNGEDFFVYCWTRDKVGTQ